MPFYAEKWCGHDGSEKEILFKQSSTCNLNVGRDSWLIIVDSASIHSVSKFEPKASVFNKLGIISNNQLSRMILPTFKIMSCGISLRSELIITIRSSGPHEMHINVNQPCNNHPYTSHPQLQHPNNIAFTEKIYICMSVTCFRLFVITSYFNKLCFQKSIGTKSDI